MSTRRILWSEYICVSPMSILVLVKWEGFYTETLMRELVMREGG